MCIKQRKTWKNCNSIQILNKNHVTNKGNPINQL